MSNSLIEQIKWRFAASWKLWVALLLPLALLPLVFIQDDKIKQENYDVYADEDDEDDRTATVRQF